ncbi:MAG: DUF899 family protein [Sphingomonas sp.]|uniref:DUF899 family protein n=1 Tax=Sphingomonas sp. TaxID=28214 RepID=UPI001B23A308|nr:DUF899 family protein [Sphingomonas sp.]MBO9621293.1 DUF899 family protein [Sphingomonas sp.]
MSTDFARMAFPNESREYRAARNALLDAEIELRRRTEAVAAMRRALPPGGAVPQDYVFERIGADFRPGSVRLSELFGDFRTILIYSYMYGPERDSPCPGCTHLLDGLDGAARHVTKRAPLYVVARSPIARLAAWAHARGWNHLQLLSTAGNAYPVDYHGNTAGMPAAMRAERGYAEGENHDEPILNVFTRDGDTIRHFWGSELVFAPEDPGQDHRGLDSIDPVWGLLDTVPEGRGDFFPKVNY